MRFEKSLIDKYDISVQYLLSGQYERFCNLLYQLMHDILDI